VLLPTTTPSVRVREDGGRLCSVTSHLLLLLCYCPLYLLLYPIRHRFQDRPCYPRYLGITRKSCLEAHMVLDMEYREQERPEHGPGGPIFFFSARFVLPAGPASITTGLGLYQKGLLLHEVISPRYHGMCHI
jgi:hypothetical protein